MGCESPFTDKSPVATGGFLNKAQFLREEAAYLISGSSPTETAKRILPAGNESLLNKVNRTEVDTPSNHEAPRDRLLTLLKRREVQTREVQSIYKPGRATAHARHRNVITRTQKRRRIINLDDGDNTGAEFISINESSALALASKQREEERARTCSRQA